MVDERTREALAIEAISLGEADLEDAQSILNKHVPVEDADMAHRLYTVFRSFVWKALEARRRDAELASWANIIASLAGSFESQWPDLAAKLDGFVELMQPAIMLGSSEGGSDPLSRKHVREIMLFCHHLGGRARRSELLIAVRLKEANLTRIMAPVIDCGWFHREVEGREVRYRLTEKGREVAAAILAQNSSASDSEISEVIELRVPSFSVVPPIVRVWGATSQQHRDAGPRNFTLVENVSDSINLINLSSGHGFIGSQMVDLKNAR
jgi:DNA-binding MarR family transcriptional regulator